MSVERVYQKKTQLEHILLRPDTYIGSVEPVTQVRPSSTATVTDDRRRCLILKQLKSEHTVLIVTWRKLSEISVHSFQSVLLISSKCGFSTMRSEWTCERSLTCLDCIKSLMKFLVSWCSGTLFNYTHVRAVPLEWNWLHRYHTIIYFNCLRVHII